MFIFLLYSNLLCRMQISNGEKIMAMTAAKNMVAMTAAEKRSWRGKNHQFLLPQKNKNTEAKPTVEQIDKMLCKQRKEHGRAEPSWQKKSEQNIQ